MPYTQDEALQTVQVADEDLWLEGPPHELFRELRSEWVVSQFSSQLKSLPIRLNG